MGEHVLELRDGIVDLARRRVEKGGQIIPLTAREADLLAYLGARIGQAVPRDELLTEVWGYASTITSRAVDATVARVRTKIERDREEPDHLVTVHGVGYCFVGERGTPPPRTNLAPGTRGRLIGRDEACKHLLDTLPASRLHTLVGPPGVGKTTLALAVADDVWRSDLARTVWSCRCAADRTEDDLIRTVSNALTLGPNDGPRAADRIGQALADRGPVLLVLDNLEQIASIAATLVTTWLDTAPELRILATSREHLAVGGERVVEVTPLDVTAGRQLVLAIADDLGRPLEPREVGRIDTLVKRLDGLPLALELAAARLTVLGLPELLERLDERFTLLRTRRRDVESRHVALRATLDWSWDLLGPAERAAWAQCAVFRSPFSLTSAEAVLDVDEPVLDVLHALRAKSLVHLDGDGRYELLESMSAYLRGKLQEDAAAEHAIEARHARWFTRQAAAPDSRRLGPVLPDLLAATEHALAQGDAGAASALIVAIDEVQRRQGPRAAHARLAKRALTLQPSSVDQARLSLVLGGAALALGDLADAETWLQSVASHSDALDDTTLGHAWMELGRVAQRQGHLARAAEHLEHAAALLDGTSRAWAWARLGVARMRAGALADARRQHERALSVAEAENEASLQAFVLASLVAVGLREGQLVRATGHGEWAIEVARAAGDRSMEALAAGNLGAVQATRGDLEAASASYQLALSLHRRSGNEAGICSVLVNLGDLEMSRGHAAEASQRLTEALGLARRLGERRQEGLANLNLGLVALDTHPSEALTCFEQAEAIFDEVGLTRLAAIAGSYRGRALSSAGDLDGALTALQSATTQLVEVGDEMQAAIARCHLGMTLLARGDQPGAQDAWSRASAAAATLSVGEGSPLGRAMSRLGAQLSSEPLDTGPG